MVLKALRKEPVARYASASEFAEDLRRVLAGLPVAARGANRRYLALRLVRRLWRRLVIAGVLGVVVTLSAVPALRRAVLLPLLVPRMADEFSSLADFRTEASGVRAALLGGADALRRWRVGSARASFTRAAQLLSDQPGEALALDGLARSEALRGESGAAASAARRAAQVSRREAWPSGDDGDRRAARGLAAGHEWELAVPALDRLFARAPSRIDIGLDLLYALLASGQTEAANATLGRLAQVPALAGGANYDPRVDLADAQVAYRLGEHQRSAAAAARARDWALGRGVPEIRLRAVRLHAEALARLDLKDEALAELSPLAGEMTAAGLADEAALCRLAIGKIVARTANNELAAATLASAMAELHARGDSAGEVGALISLAFQASKEGKLVEGQGLADRAVELAHEIGDRWSESEALVAKLALANWAGDGATGREIRETTLRALRESANRQTLLATLNNLALGAIEQLALDRAQSYLDEASGLVPRVGNRLADAGLDRAYGYLEETRGAFDAARARYEAALDKARRAGTPISIATYLVDLAWLEVAADRPDVAAERAAEAIAAHQAVGKLSDAAELQGVLAWVDARRGNRSGAYERLAASRRASGEAVEAPSFSSLVVEARIAEALGDWQRAVALRRRTVRMAEAEAPAGPLIDERYGLVRALHGAGESRESRRLARELLAEAEAHGVRGVAQGLRILLGTPG